MLFETANSLACYFVGKFWGSLAVSCKFCDLLFRCKKAASKYELRFLFNQYAFQCFLRSVSEINSFWEVERRFQKPLSVFAKGVLHFVY